MHGQCPGIFPIFLSPWHSVLCSVYYNHIHNLVDFFLFCFFPLLSTSVLIFVVRLKWIVSVSKSKSTDSYFLEKFLICTDTICLHGKPKLVAQFTVNGYCYSLKPISYVLSRSIHWFLIIFLVFVNMHLDVVCLDAFVLGWNDRFCLSLQVPCV